MRNQGVHQGIGLQLFRKSRDLKYVFNIYLSDYRVLWYFAPDSSERSPPDKIWDAFKLGDEVGVITIG